MNTRHFPAFLTALAALSVASPRLFAQGALVPSAAPGPIMKTLDQIEARTPLVAGSPGVAVATNGGITISASGSYYLTKNIIIQAGGTGNGIHISASGVTVDLNGFTISSVVSPATGSGIYLQSGVNPLSQITITNGHVRSGTSVAYNSTAQVFVATPGNGFIYGVYSPVPSFRNIFLSKISVSGVTNAGISLERGDITTLLPTGQPTSITDCTVSDCGTIGIIGDVIDKCAVSGIGHTGINGSRVLNCSSFAGFIGIKAGVVDNSHGTAVTNAAGSFQTYGLDVTASVTNSSGTAKGVNSTGIRTTTATNCNGSSISDSPTDIGTGVGLTAIIANTCTAQSDHGQPMSVNTAVGCYIWNDVGNSFISHRYNMP